MSKQLISYFLATTFAVYAAITLSSSSKETCIENVAGGGPSLSNLTYSQLSEFLLDNYDPSVGDESTYLEDRLYNALSGMGLAENDGKPVPIQRHPYLFVGSAGSTYNREILEEYGITHIIGLSRSVRPRFPSVFEYLSITNLEDGASSNISQYFGSTNQFIDKARAQKGKVLVHCWLGRSRSVSIIIAHLIKTDRIRYKEAIQLVRKTRKEASPNSHFVQELKDYEKLFFND